MEDLSSGKEIMGDAVSRSISTHARAQTPQAFTSTHHPASPSSTRARVCLPQHPAFSTTPTPTPSTVPATPAPSPPASPHSADIPASIAPRRERVIHLLPPTTGPLPPSPAVSFFPAHSTSNTSADWHLTWPSKPRRPCPAPAGKCLLITQIPWDLLNPRPCEWYPWRQKEWNTARRWMRGQRGWHNQSVFEEFQAFPSQSCLRMVGCRKLHRTAKLVTLPSTGTWYRGAQRQCVLPRASSSVACSMRTQALHADETRRKFRSDIARIPGN